MANLNIDTDLIRDWKLLRQQLLEECVLTDGCLLYPRCTINVRVQGYKHTLAISPARVAWALANPQDHLGVRDFAVHLCIFGTQGTEDEPRICCTATHIKKGHAADVAVMQKVRRRDLVLRGGTL